MSKRVRARSSSVSLRVAVILGISTLSILGASPTPVGWGIPPVVAQPVTGIALASLRGYPLLEGWIGLSILLYGFVGAFWLPVVWMQWRMRDLARAAAELDAPLPPAYHRLFRLWFWFGFPAFGAVLAIFWLMIRKPALPF